jgi:hypothetical protein
LEFSERRLSLRYWSPCKHVYRVSYFNPIEIVLTAIFISGVGKGSLTLPIPSSAPEGFKFLMTMCWNQRPSTRPSFQQIIKHLDSSKPEIILFEQEQEYAELTRIWSIEINEHLSNIPIIDISSTLQMTNDELMKKRQEELQHIIDIRTHYQKRVQQVSTLYMELKSLMMQLEQRERIIKEKERILNINGKKRTTNPISEARKKSLEIIKIATSNLNDPMHLLSQKKRHGKKSNNGCKFIRIIEQRIRGNFGPGSEKSEKSGPGLDRV